MFDETRVYKDYTGAVIVEAEGQEIQISEESAKALTMRFCSFLDWRIKPSISFMNGYIPFENTNVIDRNPLGEKDADL